MFDWETIKPLREWVLVKADERVKKTKGGMHLPDQMVMAERTMEGTGTILKVGDAKDIRRVLGEELAIGTRVAFRGFLKDASAMHFNPIGDCAVFMIRVEDLLAVVGEDVQMGAFS